MQPQIDELKKHPDLGWISALKSSSIRSLVESGSLQLSLFDQQNLMEITSDEYPDETLVACYNPLLADERREKRQELLAATEANLARLKAEVERRTKTPLSEADIGQKLGRHLDKHKMRKHFITHVANGTFSYERDEDAIEAEASLDGIYILRASQHPTPLEPEQIVRSYKNLSRVEEVFRMLKSDDVQVRPIYHREPERVRAHIFICMLATYLVWHLRQALSPLLFHDDEIRTLRQTRDPVAKATPSELAKAKRRSKHNAQGEPVHSFNTLVSAMSTRAQVTYLVGNGKQEPIRYKQYTQPDDLQQRVFKLLDLRPML